LAPAQSECIRMEKWFTMDVWVDEAAWAGKLWVPNLLGGAGVDRYRLSWCVRRNLEVSPYLGMLYAHIINSSTQIRGPVQRESSSM
jgi:hypothetical protein